MLHIRYLRDLGNGRRVFDICLDWPKRADRVGLVGSVTEVERQR
ncbi:MAG: hypothetical protein ACLTDX_02245 [[Clostridium] innocuum]